MDRTRAIAIFIIVLMILWAVSIAVLSAIG
jgi:hypothetical protein